MNNAVFVLQPIYFCFLLSFIDKYAQTLHYFFVGLFMPFVLYFYIYLYNNFLIYFYTSAFLIDVFLCLYVN